MSVMPGSLGAGADKALSARCHPFGAQQPEDRAVVEAAVLFQRKLAHGALTSKTQRRQQSYGTMVVGDRVRLDAVQPHGGEPEPQDRPPRLGRVAPAPVLPGQVVAELGAPV